MFFLPSLGLSDRDELFNRPNSALNVLLRLINSRHAPPRSPTSSITIPARSGLRVKSMSVSTTVHLNTR